MRIICWLIPLLFLTGCTINRFEEYPVVSIESGVKLPAEYAMDKIQADIRAEVDARIKDLEPKDQAKVAVAAEIVADVIRANNSVINSVHEKPPEKKVSSDKVNMLLWAAFGFLSCTLIILILCRKFPSFRNFFRVPPSSLESLIAENNSLESRMAERRVGAAEEIRALRSGGIPTNHDDGVSVANLVNRLENPQRSEAEIELYAHGHPPPVNNVTQSITFNGNTIVTELPQNPNIGDTVNLLRARRDGFVTNGFPEQEVITMVFMGMEALPDGRPFARWVEVRDRSPIMTAEQVAEINRNVAESLDDANRTISEAMDQAMSAMDQTFSSVFGPQARAPRAPRAPRPPRPPPPPPPMPIHDETGRPMMVPPPPLVVRRPRQAPPPPPNPLANIPTSTPTAYKQPPIGKIGGRKLDL